MDELNSVIDALMEFDYDKVFRTYSKWAQFRGKPLKEYGKVIRGDELYNVTFGHEAEMNEMLLWSFVSWSKE